MEHTIAQRLTAEFFGTFVLVFCGCGAAVLTAGVPEVGIGYLGIALTFGLAVIAMAYAVGPISGGHFNPAVSLGLAMAKRFAWADLVPYVVTQVVAASAAAATLFVVAHGVPGFSAVDSGFATNGYADRSPQGYSLVAVILVEIVLTAIFLYVILAVTDVRAPRGAAPIAIGFALSMIILMSISVSGTSLNPARSTGPALFAGSAAISQLWVFWLAPLVGGAFAGLSYAFMFGRREDVVSPEIG